MPVIGKLNKQIGVPTELVGVVPTPGQEALQEPDLMSQLFTFALAGTMGGGISGRLKLALERLGDYQTRLTQAEEALRGGDYVYRQTVNALREAVNREHALIAELTGQQGPAALGTIDDEAASLMKAALGRGESVLNQFLTPKPFVDPKLLKR